MCNFRRSRYDSTKYLSIGVGRDYLPVLAQVIIHLENHEHCAVVLGFPNVFRNHPTSVLFGESISWPGVAGLVQAAITWFMLLHVLRRVNLV